MSLWLAWTRNAAIAWGALMLFAATVTHLLAAIFAHAPEFGQPIAFWYGHPLYDPGRFLHWGVGLAPVRPGIAALSILLALTCVLAAFAVLALAGLLAPADLAPFKSRRGFERWDKLGQCGLLAANGLALGGVRRHGLAKFEIVSAPAGNVAIVGAPEHTDAAMLAAIAAWPGALVFVDARGLATRLARHDVLRFAPGRGDSISYNPMLAVRAGAHAWADALLLARAFLGSNDDALIEAFAALALDQLLTAPPDERNLAALRTRLAAPQRVLAEICAAWGEQATSAPAPQNEIARAVQVWRAAPNAAAERLSFIDAALALFAGGAYAQATQAHQFRFADLVAGDSAGSVAISLPPGDAAGAAPLISAMLAQLARECAAEPDIDCLGRPKRRELLVVVEAQALQALTAEHACALLPAHAAANGCRLLAQAPAMPDATREGFDAIAAIGPQTQASSAHLSKLGGNVACWRRVQAQKPNWRDWAFPVWERIEQPVAPPGDLQRADAWAAFLVLKGMRPIAARALSAGQAQTKFASGLSPVAHDWSAPALPRPDAGVAETPSASAAPVAASIRATLRRRAPPRAPTKAGSP